MAKQKFPKGVVRCNKPVISYHHGRTWDQCDVILPDKIKVKGYFDTSYGINFYFYFKMKWYCASIVNFKVIDNLYFVTFDLSKEVENE